jgi:hypothetical protein
MKAYFKQAESWLTLTAVATLDVILSACSTTSSPASSPTIPPTPQSTASATTQSPAVPAPNSSAPRQGAGTNGTVAAINGNALTLSTQQGQVIVNVSSNTFIQKTVTGSPSELQTGQFLTVLGTADASGNIAASSIAIRLQNQYPRPSPPAGISSNHTFTPRAGNNPNPSRPGNGAFGTLAKIDGNTLTLTTGQGQQVTVTIGSNTIIQKTVSATMPDL